MTLIERSDSDWTVEGRAMLGHEIIDVAPVAPDHPCYTGWYARQLGINQFYQSAKLRPLLDRMVKAGLLEKTGGVRTCREACRAPLSGLAWFAAVGIDPTHTHLEACNWRLAVDRHEAHERWAEHVRGRDSRITIRPRRVA